MKGDDLGHCFGPRMHVAFPKESPEAGVLSPRDDYLRSLRRRRLAICALLAMLLLCAAVSMMTGASDIGLAGVVQVLLGRGDAASTGIVMRLRLPRVLAALIAGGGLAVAGAVMQNVLGNPMASPSVLGVSSAAVFGANLAIMFADTGVPWASFAMRQLAGSPYAITACAFVMSVLSILLVLALSVKCGLSPESMVLSGLALNSLYMAATTILQFFAVDTQIGAAVFWSFGNLGRAGLGEIAFMGAVSLFACVFFYLQCWKYNAMANGDDFARSVGVNTAVVRLWSLVLASLLCSVCVAFLGIIGFIGLLGPHLVRRFTGNDHRFLLPASALSGAVLLLVADVVSRSAVPGVVLPVGAVTSVFGGVLFMFLLVRGAGRAWR